MKMTMSKHTGGALALVLGATLCAFTPGLAAQSNDNAQQQEQPQQSQQQSKTFTGNVVKLQNGQYALVTGQTPEGKLVGHFLDDTDKAKGFENKQVTVTGTFDQASNTIHVSDIQSA